MMFAYDGEIPLNDANPTSETIFLLPTRSQIPADVLPPRGLSLCFIKQEQVR
jgi:hypothetical protein